MVIGVGILSSKSEMGEEFLDFLIIGLWKKLKVSQRNPVLGFLVLKFLIFPFENVAKVRKINIGISLRQNQNVLRLLWVAVQFKSCSMSHYLQFIVWLQCIFRCSKFLLRNILSCFWECKECENCLTLIEGQGRELLHNWWFWV